MYRGRCTAAVPWTVVRGARAATDVSSVCVLRLHARTRHPGQQSPVRSVRRARPRCAGGGTPVTDLLEERLSARSATGMVRRWRWSAGFVAALMMAHSLVQPVEGISDAKIEHFVCAMLIFSDFLPLSREDPRPRAGAA
eukprot:SAG31_NODE_20562_length_571_cov_0.661017_1_plen_138_part_01